MAYNYPTYQPYYSYQNNLANPAPVNNTGVIWVQGEAAAKSYLVAPNNTVALWDSERPVIYLKSADASGMPSIKVLDYTIREAQNTPVSAPETKYATKTDIDDLSSRLDALRADLDNLSVKKKKKEESDD